jgi:hypothetical protein
VLRQDFSHSQEIVWVTMQIARSFCSLFAPIQREKIVTGPTVVGLIKSSEETPYA